jgi:hypothetical protein
VPQSAGRLIDGSVRLAAALLHQELADVRALNDYKEMNNPLVQRRAQELLVFLRAQTAHNDPAQRPTLLPEDMNVLDILERTTPAEAPAEALSGASDMDDYDTEECGTQDTSATQAATTTAAPATAAATTDGDDVAYMEWLQTLPSSEVVGEISRQAAWFTNHARAWFIQACVNELHRRGI